MTHLEQYKALDNKTQLKFDEKDLEIFTKEQLDNFNLAVANIL